LPHMPPGAEQGIGGDVTGSEEDAMITLTWTRSPTRLGKTRSQTIRIADAAKGRQMKHLPQTRS
jgi:hypothetical protein